MSGSQLYQALGLLTPRRIKNPFVKKDAHFIMTNVSNATHLFKKQAPGSH